MKRRPTLIVSSEDYHRAGADLIVAQITSNVNAVGKPGDHVIREWKASGLSRPSLIRARLATIHVRTVVRALGTLATPDMASYEAGLKQALGLA